MARLLCLALLLLLLIFLGCSNLAMTHAVRPPLRSGSSLDRAAHVSSVEDKATVTSYVNKPTSEVEDGEKSGEEVAENKLEKDDENSKEEEEEEDDDCENLEDESCRNRRQLVAHTDYIYTQHHHQP